MLEIAITEILEMGGRRHSVRCD